MHDSKRTFGRWLIAILAISGLALVFYQVIQDNMPKGDVRKIAGYTAWSEEIVETAEGIAVQEGGRVKPFSTLAGFTMYQMHGARSMKIKDSNGDPLKLSPTEWMLDALFRPQLADQLPTFRIDNSDVLRGIGVEPRGRRDRYSYDDIKSGIQRLITLAQSYEKISSDVREPAQQQTIDLAYNLRNYESLLGYFSFARNAVTLQADAQTGAKSVKVSSVMAASGDIIAAARAARAEGRDIDDRFGDLVGQVERFANQSRYSLFIFPPANKSTETWESAGNRIGGIFTGEVGDPATAVADVKRMEDLVSSLDEGQGTFLVSLQAFAEDVANRAKARGEYSKVPLETSYYRFDWFLNALVLFIVGTLAAMVMWTVTQPAIRVAAIFTTAVSTTAGLIICAIAITKRCIIMQRPPVGNLYDTIIFIAATMVGLALMIELLSRRRLALGLAPIIGTLFILLARRYEVGDAADNMKPLIAVLDSNYWLATHVLIITLGYSAGLLAAFVSGAYILMRSLGLDNGDKELRRSLTKVSYGIICLCLFLSLIGTVLGGIWANESWGRFWGWDPKENGALMIVLWTLAILHARLGGYIREWGLHLASIFTACIVGFSWWHVNFLGVGLHSYGFASEAGSIWVFYGVIGLFILFGASAMAYDKFHTRSPQKPRPRPSREPEARVSGDDRNPASVV